MASLTGVEKLIMEKNTPQDEFNLKAVRSVRERAVEMNEWANQALATDEEQAMSFTNADVSMMVGEMTRCTTRFGPKAPR